MEVGREPTFRDDDFAVRAMVDDAGDVGVIRALVEAVDERGERLRRVAGDAHVRADVTQALGGQDAERRPAAHDAGVGRAPNALNNLADARAGSTSG